MSSIDYKTIDDNSFLEIKDPEKIKQLQELDNLLKNIPTFQDEKQIQAINELICKFHDCNQWIPDSYVENILPVLIEMIHLPFPPTQKGLLFFASKNILRRRNQCLIEFFKNDPLDGLIFQNLPDEIAAGAYELFSISAQIPDIHTYIFDHQIPEIAISTIKQDFFFTAHQPTFIHSIIEFFTSLTKESSFRDKYFETLFNFLSQLSQIPELISPTFFDFLTLIISKNTSNAIFERGFQKIAMAFIKPDNDVYNQKIIHFLLNLFFKLPLDSRKTYFSSIDMSLLSTLLLPSTNSVESSNVFYSLCQLFYYSFESDFQNISLVINLLDKIVSRTKAKERQGIQVLLWGIFKSAPNEVKKQLLESYMDDLIDSFEIEDHWFIQYHLLQSLFKGMKSIQNSDDDELNQYIQEFGKPLAELANSDDATINSYAASILKIGYPDIFEQQHFV